MTPSALRVLVADDDPIVRRVIGATLSTASIAIAAEVTDVGSAVDAARTSSATVALVDVDLPSDGAIELTRLLRSARLPVRVVIMASVEKPAAAVEALRAGAAGYLGKDMPIDALPRVVRAVAAGEPALSRALLPVLVDAVRRDATTTRRPRAVNGLLTNREWQVLDLLCEGQGTEAIAARLFLSRETVRTHIKRLNRKLGVSTRAEAVARASAMRLADSS